MESLPRAPKIQASSCTGILRLLGEASARKHREFAERKDGRCSTQQGFQIQQGLRLSQQTEKFWGEDSVLRPSSNE
jgi:hypothetical protein